MDNFDKYLANNIQYPWIRKWIWIMSTYMFLNVFFSLTSHRCSIANSHIGHWTLQKFISSKLTISPLHSWHSRHSLLLVCTGVLKQGSGTTLASIWVPSVVSYNLNRYIFQQFRSWLFLVGIKLNAKKTVN